MSTLQLATSRYQNGDLINASGLAPTRTSRGYPRFKLKYDLDWKVPELYPTPDQLKMTGAKFDRSYCSSLDQLGANFIRDALQAVARDADKPGCVLLCFEDVNAGEPCHRRTFAAWWEDKTGESVPELG